MIGTWATVTAHSPNLHRQLAGWMSWHDDPGGDYIKLAWLGFTDCHSEIEHYYVTVGSDYGLSDLTPVRRKFIGFKSIRLSARFRTRQTKLSD